MSNPTQIGRTERIQKTVEILTETGVLPTFQAFDITEHMLGEYIRTYGSLGEGNKNKFSWSFARKLAGLELLRLKLSRGAKVKNCKEGMVYLISNPAWPEHLKIGITVDVIARLASYQTYDPHKAYRIKHYEFCLDRKAIESQLLEELSVHAAEGEWVKFTDYEKILKILKQV